MSIKLYFKFNPDMYEELYISCDEDSFSFKEFAMTVWNQTMKRRMESGESIDPDDVAVEYYAKIVEIKSTISKGVPLGVKIIKEINKIVTNHLDFVIKMCEKQTKQLKKTNQVGSGGIYAVTVSANGNSVEQVCMVCGDRQGKLKRCSACGVTCYCSAECQKRDWKEHKLVCRTKANIPNGII